MRGRITKYNKTLLKKVKGFALKGLSDLQIAHNLGIAASTLYEWKNKHPDFSEAMAMSKEIADLQVENALYKRAIGLSVIETQEISRGKGKKETKKIIKELPPDFPSMSLWLRNRKSDIWSDKREDLITIVSKEDLKKSAIEINKIIGNLQTKECLN